MDLPQQQGSNVLTLTGNKRVDITINVYKNMNNNNRLSIIKCHALSNIKLQIFAFLCLLKRLSQTPIRSSTGRNCTDYTEHVPVKWNRLAEETSPAVVCHGEQGNHHTVVALMKSAHTKAYVLTVGIKVVRVIPGVLPLSPLADLYNGLISHRHRAPVSTL